MNWGHKIIIVFVLFAAGILTLVIKSMRTRIDMATTDYYAAELKHQQNMDAQANAHALTAPVRIRQQGDVLEIVFPAEMHAEQMTGEVHFYRPSDARQDVRLPLTPDADGRIFVSRSQLHKGNYSIKLQWEAAGKPYYQETQYYIQ
ncbi:FixH family protein [Chitinophaga sp.]|uniref:FixH family protein n=1 Tax=Chitinophaga sp. TaxID=1869181 RepID=UPI0031DF4D14